MVAFGHSNASPPEVKAQNAQDAQIDELVGS